MKLFYKIFVASLLLTLLLLPVRAQDEFSYKGRFYIAPDFGLVLGYATRIDVSPALGYYLTERLSLAAGAKYEYYKLKSFYNNNSLETHIYGSRIFARYTIIRNLGELLPIRSNIEILTHVEFESLSLENQYFGTGLIDTGRFWYNTLLIGGGISQAASERFKLNAVFLWDVDTSSRSPFTNPIINIGIQIMLGPIGQQAD